MPRSPCLVLMPTICTFHLLLSNTNINTQHFRKQKEKIITIISLNKIILLHNHIPYLVVPCLSQVASCQSCYREKEKYRHLLWAGTFSWSTLWGTSEKLLFHLLLFCFPRLFYIEKPFPNYSLLTMINGVFLKSTCCFKIIPQVFIAL